MTGGYSVKVNGGENDGKYLFGKSGENKLNFGTSPALNTFSFESNSVIMTSNTSVMRFNNTSGQNRFRYFKASTYSSQQPIQLYKKSATTPTHSIHFHPNGGIGTMDDQIVNEFEPTPLFDNAFTREGFVFEGWNTEADGTGDYYADGATVNLLDNLDLYAQWDQLFYITLTEVNHGSISVSTEQAFEEDEIILTATPDPCYALDHWLVTDAQGFPITVTDNLFEMPASDVTVGAMFSYSPQSFVQEYQLVTSVEQLVAGRIYLIVNVDSGKALGTTQNANNRSAVDVTINGGVIPIIDNDVCELILGAAGSHWTFFDAGWGNNGGYLYAASSNNNQLKTQAVNNANGQWCITIGMNGTATLTAQGSNTHNRMKYNSQNNIFSCYANDMQEVYLFRRTEINDYPAEQVADLAQGWNWWAPTIDMTVDEFKSSLGTNGILINSQSSGYLRYENGSWNGTLYAIVLGEMYKIQTSLPCSLVLNGNYVSSVIVTIKSGYNWFGYTGQQTLAIENLMITPAEGDKIISQDEGYAIYENGTWSNTLNELRPGHGYVYISNASENKILSFP